MIILLLCYYSNQYYAMNNLHQIIFIKYFRNVSTTINKNNLDITYFRPWASNSNMRVSLKEKVVMPLIFFNAYINILFFKHEIIWTDYFETDP